MRRIWVIPITSAQMACRTDATALCVTQTAWQTRAGTATAGIDAVEPDRKDWQCPRERRIESRLKQTCCVLPG